MTDNVLPHDPDDSTFKRVETTQTTDTTSETAARPVDNPGESSLGVEGTGSVHESGQDETPGDEASGTDTSRS